MLKAFRPWILAVTLTTSLPVFAADTAVFGPDNPFHAPSTLPFHAPPFDKIRDTDYQPAIEAGMAQQRKEIEAVDDDRKPATFENTLVPMERSGLLLARSDAAFMLVNEANTNPRLQAVQAKLAPKLAAHHDAIYLDPKLFARVAAVYGARQSLKLDPESLRLLEVTYDEFVRSGAKLGDADKAALRRLNEEASTLSDSFTTKLLAATQAGALHATTPEALAGFGDAGLAAAAEAAKARKTDGYVVPLQNTTQQPDFSSLTDRNTRHELFDDSWGSRGARRRQ